MTLVVTNTEENLHPQVFENKLCGLGISKNKCLE